jgi:mannose-6-phosphate isomerase-like protein (cupin superfamily)
MQVSEFSIYEAFSYAMACEPHGISFCGRSDGFRELRSRIMHKLGQPYNDESRHLMQRSHAMKIVRSKTFTAERPWGALDIANMNGVTTRLHWTDQPYRWHVNDGEEVFAVLDGRVEMRYREAGIEHSTILEAGDIFHASVGTEHVAHPIGEARILVIESEGSI